MEFSEELKRAWQLIEKGHQHVFLTGRAGTGKSTFLEYFRNHTAKNIVVLAPTGVAAVNVGGQTIHSFFHFPIGVTVKAVSRINPRKSVLFKHLNTIVIDEISMVRADLFDCIDKFLRLNGPHKDLPFGGIQMLFVGDPYQLPPVVREEDIELFQTIYQSPYFFDANVYKQIKPYVIELTTVYRQEDQDFVALLDRIRHCDVSSGDINKINNHTVRKAITGQEDLCINLTSTNKSADQINDAELSKLPTNLVEFEAHVEGKFPEGSFPTKSILMLKEGARVMLLNNDSEGRWVNGDVGIITGFEEEELDEDTTFITGVYVKLRNGDVEVVRQHKWEYIRYFYNEQTKTIDSEVLGSFSQYPLRLAWAVTIHKGQGQTFDNVVIHLGHGAFASGQTYVALSRCRTLEGISLSRPIREEDIFIDRRVEEFMQKKAA